jgi:hypothetical protein
MQVGNLVILTEDFSSVSLPTQIMPSFRSYSSLTLLNVQGMIVP